jgi:WhiB family redox-sensing transcriptional regulator
MTRVIDSNGVEIPIDAVGIFELLAPEHQQDIAWQRDAACRKVVMGTPQRRVHAFFPDRGKPADRAKAVCATCPVWRECLEYALVGHEREGVWGGTTEKQRRVILRARRAGQEVDLRRPTLPPPRTPRCGHQWWCDDWDTYVKKCGRMRVQPHLPPFAPRKMEAVA